MKETRKIALRCLDASNQKHFKLRPQTRPFVFRHRKSTTEQENTFSVLSCGVEAQPADMNPDSFHHSRRSVTIHLPSLTSPWSLRRTLAPWRQRRVRKASTQTHTRGNVSFYPLSDLWLHTQNEKPAWEVLFNQKSP